MEVCPISSQQPTHEGGREGRDGDTKKERENILLSNAAFDFCFSLTLDFTLSLEFQRRSYCRLIFIYKDSGFFSKDLKAFWHTFGDALRKYFKSDFDIPLAWPVELNL